MEESGALAKWPLTGGPTGLAAAGFGCYLGLVASTGRANGPRHVGLVVDPLVLEQGQTEPELCLTAEPAVAAPPAAPAPPAATALSAPASETSEMPGEESEPQTAEPGPPPSELPPPAVVSPAPPSEPVRLVEAIDELAGLRRGGARERLLERARAAAEAPSSLAPRGLDEFDAVIPEASRPIEAELDLVGTPHLRVQASVAPRPRGAALSPGMLAVVGSLLGLASVASIVVLAMKLDPHVAARLVTSAEVPDEVAVPPPEAAVATPAAAPPVQRQRRKVPGPWRILDDKDQPGARVVTGTIGREPFLRVIQDKGVSKNEAYRVLKAFEGVVDLDRPKRADSFLALLDRGTGKLKAFEYVRTKEEVFQARVDAAGQLQAKRLDLQLKHEQYQGGFVMNGSLDDSAKAGGFAPGLRSALEVALRGHLSPDFDRGDRVRLIVQEVTVLGEFSRYAGLEAFEYLGASGKKKRIYYFKGTKERGYYDAEGRAPYEGGWRTPIPGAPITSHFNPNRMHPVLHRRMPHNGTDFGCQSGTPIHASSFGTVVFVGPAGPAGNLVRIEHPGGIETGYFHLSRFEPGVNVGDKVDRMQVIGYCGSTGRSTGPHLHFAVKKNGTYVDAMTLKLDAMRVIDASERDAFAKAKAEYDKLLDAIPLPPALAVETPPTASATPGEMMAEGDEEEANAATGGADVPAAPAAPAAPAPAAPQRPGAPGASIYLTDKELLEMQSGSDDGEVE